MPETLLTQSVILLYGRVMEDLKIVRSLYGGGEDLGANRFLRSQFLSSQHKKRPKLARIYAYTYEGHYYDLRKPALFLVHGNGFRAERLDTNSPRLARGVSNADKTGVALQDGSFSADMRVWRYDKGDFTVRLDLTTGPFEQVLLEEELSGDSAQPHYSGDKAWVRRPGRPSD